MHLDPSFTNDGDSQDGPHPTSTLARPDPSRLAPSFKIEIPNDRETLVYREPHRHVRLAWDPSDPPGLYSETIQVWHLDNGTIACVSEDEQIAIARRIIHYFRDVLRTRVTLR